MVVESAAMTLETAALHNARVILFTRFPVPGEVKTRLIPFLGADGAADLQRRMTEFMVRQVRRTGVPMQIRYVGGSESQMREWLGIEAHYAPQGPGDLGERMSRAFAQAFEDGADKVLVIGCDCPDNRSTNILEAIKKLDEAPCVIGPASDGGYYLIGLREPYPELFQGIDWGTGTVFRQTVGKIHAHRLLSVLDDVDEPRDIPPRISVIIPALNEEGVISATVAAAQEGFDTEAIVVDGGSVDKTVEIAHQSGADTIVAESGRALQMNCGAHRATGDILLFLHADSELPPDWDCHVRKILKHPDTILGHFNFAVKERFPGKRLIEIGANVRSRLFKRPYGDQGLFLRRAEFEALGRFPIVPILEDYYLVKQAADQGHVRCADAKLVTSGRRWVQHGALRTTLLNQAILLAAWLGHDPAALRDAYAKGKNPFFRR
jgi:hypothetical protein